MKNKIKKIQEILKEYGSFSMNDVFDFGEEIESVILMSSDDFSIEAYYFFEDFIVADLYINNHEISDVKSSYTFGYDDVSENVIDKILKLAIKFKNKQDESN